MIQGGSTAACCGRSPSRAGLLHACRVICCIPLSSLNLQLPSPQLVQVDTARNLLARLMAPIPLRVVNLGTSSLL